MRFSIIIPVYFSHQTIQRCIDGLRNQTFKDYEVIFVDSTPDERSAEIISKYSDMTLIRSDQRLWMHAARNVGADRAGGEILVFTDPDCYAEPDWLLKLHEAFQAGHVVVGGPIACYTDGYMETVAHLVKFWPWLPNGASRSYDQLLTANLAIKRDVFTSVGGFSEKFISGDTQISFKIRDEGFDLYFDNGAIVNHIHTVTLTGLIRERFIRGKDFASMRSELQSWNKSKSLSALAAIWLIPYLICFRRMIVCLRRGFASAFLQTALLLFVADVFWVLGESIAYWRHLFGLQVIKIASGRDVTTSDNVSSFKVYPQNSERSKETVLFGPKV